MQFYGMRGMGLFEALKKAASDFSEDDMTTYASALAYQTLFSLFPFVLFLTALLGFFNLSSFFEWLQGQAEMMLPEQASAQLDNVITGLSQPQGGLLSFGVIAALWSASSAVRVVMNAMNVAYDVKEGRPAWKLYPLSVLYTIGLAAMLIAATAFLMLGPQVMRWLSDLVGLGNVFVTIWAWLRWPAALLLLMMAVAIIYYVAPDVDQKFKFITPGAVLAVLVWLLASLGFKIYVSNFADYNAMYGSIGAIIVLLFYFFISSAVLLFGAEINAVIEHYSPQGKNPGEKKLH